MSLYGGLLTTNLGAGNERHALGTAVLMAGFSKQ